MIDDYVTRLPWGCTRTACNHSSALIVWTDLENRRRFILEHASNACGSCSRAHEKQLTSIPERALKIRHMHGRALPIGTAAGPATAPSRAPRTAARACTGAQFQGGQAEGNAPGIGIDAIDAVIGRERRRRALPSRLVCIASLPRDVCMGRS